MSAQQLKDTFARAPLAVTVRPELVRMYADAGARARTSSDVHLDSIDSAGGDDKLGGGATSWSKSRDTMSASARTSSAKKGRGSASKARSRPVRPVRSVLRTYVLTNDSGTAARQRGARAGAAASYRTYSASKPSLAATKAFYAFMRSSLGHSIVDAARASSGSGGSASGGDVRVKVCLRRPDENRVRRYLVRYVAVTAPNRHERLRGISRVAHAQPLRASDPDRYDDTVDLAATYARLQ